MEEEVRSPDNQRAPETTGKRTSGANRTMLRNVLFVSLAFVILATLAAYLRGAFEEQATQTDDQEEPYESVYVNNQYGFRMEFPNGWQQSDGDGITVRQASKGNATMSIRVQAFPPGTVSEDMDIADFMNVDQYMQEIQAAFPDARIIDSGTTTIGNETALWIKHSANYNILGASFEGIVIDYQLIHDDVFFSITAGATEDEFLMNENAIVTAVQSFSFTGS